MLLDRIEEWFDRNKHTFAFFGIVAIVVAGMLLLSVFLHSFGTPKNERCSNIAAAKGIPCKDGEVWWSREGCGCISSDSPVRTILFPMGE